MRIILNLQWIFIIALIAALTLSLMDTAKHAGIVRDKNAVIYDLTLDNNWIKNQNQSLKEALLNCNK